MDAVDITVVIPTIPPRTEMLQRAVSSAVTQTCPPAAVITVVDSAGDGAPITRQRGLEIVTTGWVAFLDDDDYMLPNHLETLAGAVRDGADYAYSYFYIGMPGRPLSEDDSILGHFGRPFDPADPIQTTVTTLVRTEIAQKARFDHRPDGWIHGQRAGEDFQFTLACVGLGARVVHVPRRTWVWSHHAGPAGNTSGRPWNDQANWG